MSKRDLITVADFSPEEIMQIFEWAGAMRKDRTVDSTLLQEHVGLWYCSPMNKLTITELESLV